MEKRKTERATARLPMSVRLCSVSFPTFLSGSFISVFLFDLTCLVR